MRYAAICLAEEVNESRLGYVLIVSRSPYHTGCYPHACDLVSNDDQARKRILLVIGFVGVIVLMAMWNALLYTNQVRARVARAVVILHCRLRSYCVSAAMFSELLGV